MAPVEREKKSERREAVLFLRPDLEGYESPESDCLSSFNSQPLSPPAESTHHVAITQRAWVPTDQVTRPPTMELGDGAAEVAGLSGRVLGAGCWCQMFHHRACCGAAQACPKPIGGWLGTGRLARAFRFPVPGATTAS
jgi:hypothetical protein